MTDDNTKQKVLNAAERLIAERGFDGASLRAITKETGINPAAVHSHYHKQNLVGNKHTLD